MTARERGPDGEFRILVFGTGELAKELCEALVAGFDRRTVIMICGRSEKAAKSLCFVNQSLALARGRDATFVPAAVPEFDLAALSATVAEFEPDAVVCAASLSSSWEGERSASQWTRLISGPAFGLSLPLQAVIPARVAAAIKAAGSDALLLNACYPDAVNRLLASLGLQVHCGLGNISTIALTLRCALRLPDHDRIRAVAHHRHLYGALPDGSDVRLWKDGKAVPEVGKLLGAQRTSVRAHRYPLIAAAGAELLAAIASAEPSVTHVPGPAGLSGGYPVRITGREIEVLLPPDETPETVEGWQRSAAEADGAWVDKNGDVTFSAAAADAIGEHVPALREGFPAADLPSVAQTMLELRDRLRS